MEIHRYLRASSIGEVTQRRGVSGRPRQWLLTTQAGMDQTGAYGLALEGASYDEILKHYYQGIQITPIGH